MEAGHEDGGRGRSAGKDRGKGVVRAMGASIAQTARLLAAGRLSSPAGHVGRRLRFADGTEALVFRETLLAARTADPCILVVRFKLRLLGRARAGHAAFRRECVLHLPMFAGFEGFRSKLWLWCPAACEYRGLYEWDGPKRARDYAERLSKVLRAVSRSGSVAFHVLPGMTREDALAGNVSAEPPDPCPWWRPAGWVEPSDGAAGGRSAALAYQIER